MGWQTIVGETEKLASLLDVGFVQPALSTELEAPQHRKVAHVGRQQIDPQDFAGGEGLIVLDEYPQEVDGGQVASEMVYGDRRVEKLHSSTRLLRREPSSGTEGGRAAD